MVGTVFQKDLEADDFEAGNRTLLRTLLNPFSTEGMYSLGMRPPMTLSSKTKFTPSVRSSSGIGPMRPTIWPY